MHKEAIMFKKLKPKEKMCPLTRKVCIKDKCAWWYSVTIGDGRGNEAVINAECAMRSLGYLDTSLHALLAKPREEVK